MRFFKTMYSNLQIRLLNPLVRKINEYFENQSRHTERLNSKIAELEQKIDSLDSRLIEVSKFKFFKNHIEKKNYYIQQILIHKKYRDKLSLVPFEYQIHSQNGEDGIIAEIFHRIGASNHYFVEFGASNGEENNTANLLNLGRKGLWIECDENSYDYIQTKYLEKIKKKQLVVLKEAVNAENIEALFHKGDVPQEFDLLSIDIDGNDYWVWKAIKNFNPRAVVIEYNQGMGPSREYKMPYNSDYMWDMVDGNYGVSLKSIEILGKEKGYSLVGCSLLGPNAFLVRDDLCKDLFQKPYTSEFHFVAPNVLTYAFELSPNYRGLKF